MGFVGSKKYASECKSNDNNKTNSNKTNITMQNHCNFVENDFSHVQIVMFVVLVVKCKITTLDFNGTTWHCWFGCALKYP